MLKQVLVHGTVPVSCGDIASTSYTPAASQGKTMNAKRGVIVPSA